MHLELEQQISHSHVQELGTPFSLLHMLNLRQSFAVLKQYLQSHVFHFLKYLHMPQYQSLKSGQANRGQANLYENVCFHEFGVKFKLHSMM